MSDTPLPKFSIRNRPPPKPKASQNNGAELLRLRAEVAELKRGANQQLMSEVKYLRAQKTDLEGQVRTLKAEAAKNPAREILAKIIANSDPEGLPLELGAGAKLRLEALELLTKTRAKEAKPG